MGSHTGFSFLTFLCQTPGGKEIARGAGVEEMLGIIDIAHCNANSAGVEDMLGIIDIAQ
jgi:hypothetical protein